MSQLVSQLIRLVVIATVLGSSLSNSSGQNGQNRDREVPAELQHMRQMSDAFAYIAELMVPSVVTILSTKVMRSEELEELHQDEDVKEYFRWHMPKEFRQQGSGSGIIVRNDGYILTNVHVVDEAENLRVILSDNREFEADIIGLDPLTEVAVIKVNAEDLPAAILGNSDAVRVGDWVLAIGNPLDLRSTVTAGIVSAKERQIDIIRESYSVESFIQTDAAINPGNSGGALVNLYGEVIGVNTAIATENGYNAGFGFAIPINLANKIMTDIIYKGRVERAHLGVAMQNINERRARALGLERPQGVFIDQVMDGTPAQRYGLNNKDVILRIDGTAVNRTNQIQAIIAARDPGSEVILDVWRDGLTLQIRVRLDKRTATRMSVAAAHSTADFENLGLEVTDLQEKTARALGYDGKAGVLVKSVIRMSPADQSRIREDDIIIEVNDIIIETARQFEQLIAELEPGAIPVFTISRDNERYHFFVENPE